MTDPYVTRCYAVTGSVYTGPRFCGYPAKTEDANGRPVCGVHKDGQPGIDWVGDGSLYPAGTGGSWRFMHGDVRP